MTKHQAFLNKSINQILLLDGATGTNLQAAGMPVGVSPERWILENPEILAKLQEDFYEAGSSIVYAFTFGANRIKLAGLGDVSEPGQVELINSRLADISCRVRDKMRRKYPGRTFYVAGDLAPSGAFLLPAGDLDFDELVEIYREQVRGLLASGVDLFVAETMMDLAQTRAAVIAVREETDLPVLASVTVDDSGRTLSGNNFEVCLLSLAATGAQAVGLNCSSGPLNMADSMNVSVIPANCMLLAKPNAGVPKLNEAGETVFDLAPDDFAKQMMEFVNHGAALIGGCCGTTPLHISALSSELMKHCDAKDDAMSRLIPVGNILTNDQLELSIIASQRKTCALTNWREWPVLKCVDVNLLAEDILDILEDEPEAVQIKLEFSEMPELSDFKEAINELQLTCSIPVIFKTDDHMIQSWLSRYYNGLTAVITDNPAPDLAVYYLAEDI